MLSKLLVSVVLIGLTSNQVAEATPFCATDHPTPDMAGIWMCEADWLEDVVPSPGRPANVDLMSDGDVATSVTFQTLDSTRRSLIFKMPDYYVLTGVRLRLGAQAASSSSASLLHWDDITFDTYNRTSPDHWIRTADYPMSEAVDSVLNMEGFSQLAKYWRLELPNELPLTVADIAFRIIARIPKNGDLSSIQVHFESQNGEEIDPEQLSADRFRSASYSAPTTHQCATVQRGVPDAIRRKYRINTAYYHKYTSAYGVPILSSYQVDDRALQRACYTVRFMLADNAGIRNHMYANKGRVSIIARTETVPGLPEYRHLRGWTHRAAGGTYEIPVTVGAAENVLCDRADPFGRQQDILMHEFAHGVQLIAARTAIPDFTSRLQRNFLAARNRGLWRNTYANTNNIEYFAEATQAFFNQQRLGPKGGDGIQNDINTRTKLRNYDYGLYKLVEEIYPCAATNYIHRCDDISQSRGMNQVFKMNCARGTGGGGGGGGGSGCVDKQTNCQYWKGENYCTSTQWGSYMTENCPKSCGKCATTTTAATTTTTTVITGGSCVDKKDNCGYWHGQNFCTEGEWISWMADNCPKTCGKCPVTTTTELLTPPPLTTTTEGVTTKACEDTKENCNYWQEEGYCETGDWKEWMAEHCPKSCKKCGAVVTPPPIITTTTPQTTTTTPAPTTTSTSKPCIDQHTNCNYWLSEGYCSSDEWGNWMAENCAKSCKKCSGGGLLTPLPLSTTSTLPTTTTTTKKPCQDKDNDCKHWDMYCDTNQYVRGDRKSVV